MMTAAVVMQTGTSYVARVFPSSSRLTQPGSTAFSSMANSNRQKVVPIHARRLPEGVWLATSDDVPGLVVETETREELEQIAPELALELIHMDRLFAPDVKVRFSVIFA